jgi:hypothetical protein
VLISFRRFLTALISAVWTSLKRSRRRRIRAIETCYPLSFRLSSRWPRRTLLRLRYARVFSRRFSAARLPVALAPCRSSWLRRELPTRTTTIRYYAPEQANLLASSAIISLAILTPVIPRASYMPAWSWLCARATLRPWLPVMSLPLLSTVGGVTVATATRICVSRRSGTTSIPIPISGLVAALMDTLRLLITK